MENQNAPEGGDQNPNNQPDAVEPKVDLRAELDDRFRQFESSLLEKIAAAQAPKKPELTAEQYQELLKNNPAAALEMAVEKTVQAKLNPALSQLTAEQKKLQFDTRAEQEFPALKTDKAFQQEVAAKARELVASGEYSKDSAQLVYRAAEFVDLKMKAKGRQSAPRGGMSAEAPSQSGERRTSAESKKPNNFEVLSKMFGLDDASKERFLAKQKEKGGR